MVLEIAAGILLAWVIVSIVGAVVELLLGIAGHIVVNGIRAVQRYSLRRDWEQSRDESSTSLVVERRL